MGRETTMIKAITRRDPQREEVKETIETKKHTKTKLRPASTKTTTIVLAKETQRTKADRTTDSGSTEVVRITSTNLSNNSKRKDTIV